MKPSESSASRMAPTRPSIMSDGATMSDPARAWHTTWGGEEGEVSCVHEAMKGGEEVGKGWREGAETSC